MVVGDDVGGGDDEEALEIPLSGVESRINLAPKTKIVVPAALCFAKCRVLPGGSVFRVYIAPHEGGRRDDDRGPNGHWWRGQRVGPRHLASFGPRGSPLVIQSSRCLLLMKNLRGIFPRFYFLRKLDKKETLLKTTSDSAVFIQVW